MSNWETRFTKKGFTFNDVLLIPTEGHVLPDEVDMNVQLIKNIKLNIPIISASMDTVTNSKITIAMMRQDGLGVIHKSMTISQQADEVREIRRFESDIIIDPSFLTSQHLVTDAEELMNKYRIGGVSVIETLENRELVGIITNHGMRFVTDCHTSIADVMAKDNLATTPVGISLKDAEKILQEHKIEKLPIIDNEGRLSGLITVKDIEKVIESPNVAKGEHGRLFVAVATGVTNSVFERVNALLEAGVDAVVIGTTHGHNAGVIRKIQEIRSTFADTTLIAGNVTTTETIKTLYDAGVDVVRVGIEPGSICTTRVVAGVGVPQLTAVYDVASVARQCDEAIIADGGIRYSGDIVKALAADGHAIMLGSMLAGTGESSSELEIFQERRFKTYRGMGSLGAMEKGSKDCYFQGNVNETNKLIPEGIEGRVAYKGSVADIIFQMIGGLRSGMDYIGAVNLQQSRDEAQFIQVNDSGLKESHPHDVQITKEAPNYSVESQKY